MFRTLRGAFAALASVLAMLTLQACGDRAGRDSNPDPPPPRDAAVPSDRITRWSPGIPGGIPSGWNRIHTTIRAADHAVNGTHPDGFSAAVNAALRAAAAVASADQPQVVFVEEGTYRNTDTIVFDHYRYVVLRGAGPERTRIRNDRASGPVIRFNGTPSEVWSTTGGHLTRVVGDVPQGATRITVEDATGIAVGDIVQLDQLDDRSYVYFYDGYYFKRGWDGPGGWSTYGPLSPGGYRSVNELLEVVGKSGNVLDVSAGRRADGSPEPWGTHFPFRAALRPELWVVSTTRAGQPHTSAWCGVEGLYLTGGVNRTISMTNTSYSWVKDVEIDGNPWTTGIPAPPGGYQHFASYGGSPTPNLGGNETPIYLDHAFRCEIARAYVHHTRTIQQGGSSYGICIAMSSNNLVWDSIVVYFDKCITGRTPGGGNVIAYNYVDNAFTAQRGWQEGAIDPAHNGFGHMDLVEGNWTAEMGVESTHGNSGWMTFFRNYSQGRNSGPTPVDLLTPPPGTPGATVFGGQPAAMTGNTHAFQATAWTREMTVVGNVLNQDIVRQGQAPVYEKTSDTPFYPAPVYRVGDNLWSAETWDTQDGTTPPQNVRSSGASALRPEDDARVPYPVASPTFTTRAIDVLYRHGNWDSVTGGVVWDPSNPHRTLPDSLFLSAKPAFFGDLPWPWIDPTGATAADRVKTLPAKARHDAGRPNGG
ncbi:MAG TPA: hypothetical protein VEB43_02630 [Anaeromyxobacter sp.]|nr:hypothetical protein [Anaeromyxobacter sp.]